MRMKVTHEMTFARRCPVDDALDQYELRVETTRTVKVEDILAAIEALPEKAFQEDITTTLAAKLGCSVTTVGYHSGVKTTVECNIS
jgi:hypothetical protein